MGGGGPGPFGSREPWRLIKSRLHMGTALVAVASQASPHTARSEGVPDMFDVITGAAGGIGDAVRHAIANLPGGSASFTVQPERVFELANRFDSVADTIQSGVSPETWALIVAAPGADKPSQDAADRLTRTAYGDAGLITRLSSYVDELRRAAVGLRQTGHQYGLTDHTESGRLGAAF